MENLKKKHRKVEAYGTVALTLGALYSGQTVAVSIFINDTVGQMYLNLSPDQRLIVFRKEF